MATVLTPNELEQVTGGVFLRRSLVALADKAAASMFDWNAAPSRQTAYTSWSAKYDGLRARAEGLQDAASAWWPVRLYGHLSGAH